jgi:uncharacterized membrane protein required for colicin V production
VVPLETVFLGLVLLFGIIGALRGWAKELLVSFSVILARFIEYVCLNYVPILKESLQSLRDNANETWFFVRFIIFIILVSFGYATTVLSAHLSSRARKEKFQDTLLGVFLGAINGYLVVGVIWGFLDELGYGIWNISGPTNEAAKSILPYLPLGWLEGPTLLVGVAIAFAFVLIVFV